MENEVTGEVKSWLQTLLKKNVDDFSVKIEGGSEKGDGYTGDIIFVSLSPTKNANSSNSYDFVIKRSRSSDDFAQKLPINDAYRNEKYIYEKVFPAFTQFQLERGVTDFFTSVPKCYGALEVGDRVVIVFENLRKIGYSLWNKNKPLTRKHLDMVLSEYAKMHAVSIAMKDQEGEKFKELSGGVKNVMQDFYELSGMEKSISSSIDETCKVLQDDLDENTLARWRKLKDKLSFVFTEMIHGMDGVKVILHGDCWNNNFLYKHVMDDETLPSNVAILDWQMSRYSSPILDLSYFIFATISSDDIQSLDNILRQYHTSLNGFVNRLGSSLDILYPYDKFIEDWRKYCIYGLAFCSLVLKVCASDKDEVVDVEKNEDFNKMFTYDIKDKSCFKDRVRHIVRYAVENNLI